MAYVAVFATQMLDAQLQPGWTHWRGRSLHALWRWPGAFPNALPQPFLLVCQTPSIANARLAIIVSLCRCRRFFIWKKFVAIRGLNKVAGR